MSTIRNAIVIIITVIIVIIVIIFIIVIINIIIIIIIIINIITIIIIIFSYILSASQTQKSCNVRKHLRKVWCPHKGPWSPWTWIKERKAVTKKCNNTE